MDAEWSGLLREGLAAAAALSSRAVFERLLSPDLANGGEYCLSRGTCGRALALAYAEKVCGRPEFGAAARRSLDESIATLREYDSHPSLFGGFVGVAWTMAHLSAMWGVPAKDEFDFEEVDALLVDHVRSMSPPVNFDLISGLVGIGVYALERWPASRAQELLTDVVRQLVSASESDSIGATWFTPPTMVPLGQREIAPQGYFNLGLAHGIPGVIALLGRVSGVGALDDEGRRTLERGVEWLVDAGKDGVAGTSRYPSWIAKGRPRPHSSRGRVAWCYGDLGVAAALSVAAEGNGREDWRSRAIDIMRACAAVPVSQSGVVDHGLCHGSAGNALIFSRFAQRYNDRPAREAATRWYAHTLDTRHDEIGLGGYVAWVGKDKSAVRAADTKFHYEPDESFLAGAAGVALALAAAISDDAPAWDRCMLISLHERELKTPAS